MTGIKRKTDTPDNVQEDPKTPTKRSKRIQEAQEAKLNAELTATNTPRKSPSPKQKKGKKGNKGNKDKKKNKPTLPITEFFVEKNVKAQKTQQESPQKSKANEKTGKKKEDKDDKFDSDEDFDIDVSCDDEVSKVEKEGSTQNGEHATPAVPAEPKKIHPFFESKAAQQQRIKEEQLQKEKLRKEADKQIMGSTGVPTATIFLTKEQKREKAKEDNLRVLREEIRERAEETRALNQGKNLHTFFTRDPEIWYGRNYNSLSDIECSHAAQGSPSPYPLLTGAYIPDFPIVKHVRQLTAQSEVPLHHSSLYQYCVTPETPHKASTIVPLRHSALVPSFKNLEKGNSQHKEPTEVIGATYGECINDIHAVCDKGSPDVGIQVLTDLQKWCTGKYRAGTDSNENPMWTEKYRPDGVENIIGNSDKISFFANWLNSWKQKEQRRWSKFIAMGEQSKGKRKTKRQKKEGKGEKLHNTLVLVGPPGAGKSGAIAAAAKQNSFEILEMNSSTRRTAKLLTEVFGEATQSHQVGKNTDNTTSSNLIHTLMVIEDLDLVHEESKSFFNTLEELINTSKRPFILTCNEITPPIQQLFQNPNVVQCNFTYPSPELLARNLCCIALTEESVITPRDMLHLVRWLNCDIRQTTLSLQFWIQDKPSEKAIRTDSKKMKLKKRSHVFERYLGFGDVIRRIRHSSATAQGSAIEDEVSLLEQAQGLGLDLIFENYLSLTPIQHLLGDGKENGTNGKQATVTATSSKAEAETAAAAPSKEVPSQIKDAMANMADVLSSLDLLEAGRQVDDISREKFCTFPPTYEGAWSRVNSLNDVLPATLSAMSYNRACSAAEKCKWLLESPPRNAEDEYSIFTKSTGATFNEKCENAERISNAIFQGCRSYNSGSGLLSLSNLRLDYQPALHAIIETEDIRRGSNTKRGGRFKHYLENFTESNMADVKALALNVIRDTTSDPTATEEKAPTTEPQMPILGINRTISELSSLDFFSTTV